MSAPPALAPFTDSAPLLGDPEALRAQFAAEGYVYVRGVVDPDVVSALHADVVEVCRRHGWLEPSADPHAAVPIVGPRVEGEAAYLAVYDDIQRLERFHALPHHPSVRRPLTALLGDSAFPHPLSIARLAFPDNAEWSTPAHQDYPNNQGTEDLYACWVPLTTCPLEQGTLAILRGSHRFGIAPLEGALGAGHRRSVLDDRYATCDWVSSDLEIGDVLVFHSLTVHRAMPNLSRSLRLSVDYRFQREGEALTEGCLEPHFGRLTWDEVYAGWERTDLQWYWLTKRYDVVPWNDELHAISDEEFVELLKEWLKWRGRHPVDPSDPRSRYDWRPVPRQDAEAG